MVKRVVVIDTGYESYDQEQDILAEAMMTKDSAEVDRIRKMGQLTVDVVGRTSDFLVSHQVRHEVLVKRDGCPLRIGEVKGRILIHGQDPASWPLAKIW